MPDTNENLIPDKVDRVIGAVLLAANAIFTALHANGVGKSWVPYVLAAMLGLASVFGVGLIGRPGKNGK